MDEARIKERAAERVAALDMMGCTISKLREWFVVQLAEHAAEATAAKDAEIARLTVRYNNASRERDACYKAGKRMEAAVKPLPTEMVAEAVERTVRERDALREQVATLTAELSGARMGREDLKKSTATTMHERDRAVERAEKAEATLKVAMAVADKEKERGDNFKAKCEKAEAERDQARSEIERIRGPREIKCEGCGLHGPKVTFNRINLTNGMLRLCGQCLYDVTRKTAAASAAQVERLREVLRESVAVAAAFFRWQASECNECMPHELKERSQRLLGDELIDVIIREELGAPIFGPDDCRLADALSEQPPALSDKAEANYPEIPDSSSVREQPGGEQASGGRSTAELEAKATPAPLPDPNRGYEAAYAFVRSYQRSSKHKPEPKKYDVWDMLAAFAAGAQWRYADLNFPEQPKHMKE